MIFYYIRHGDPIYDPDSLTPLGALQAEALAKRLARYGLDEIFVSSSNRAQLTAAPTCRLLHKEMKILDWCNECHAWDDFAYTGEDGVASWVFHKQAVREFFVSDEVQSLGKNGTRTPPLPTAISPAAYPAYSPSATRFCRRSATSMTARRISTPACAKITAALRSLRTRASV